MNIIERSRKRVWSQSRGWEKRLAKRLEEKSIIAERENLISWSWSRGPERKLDLDCEVEREGLIPIKRLKENLQPWSRGRERRLDDWERKFNLDWKVKREGQEAVVREGLILTKRPRENAWFRPRDRKRRLDPIGRPSEKADLEVGEKLHLWPRGQQWSLIRNQEVRREAKSIDRRVTRIAQSLDRETTHCYLGER